MSNDFVQNPADYTVTIANPENIEGLGDWEAGIHRADPSSPWTLVNERFNTTSAEAERWATLLEGYLEDLEGIISEFPDTDIGYTPITIGDDIAVDVSDAPILGTDIQTNFPDFEPTPYSLEAIPEVDTSSLTPGTLPTDITEAISWLETTYDETAYQLIMTQLVSDLSSGAGGLGGTVEQEIYDRAVARQDVDNDAKQREIEEYASSRGFDLPTGAMMGRLQEQTNVTAANNLDINGKILIEQADLAQKNQQFVITSIKDLDALSRDYEAGINTRALDYRKAVAAIAIQRYSEQLRAYLADAEAKKIYVTVQLEVLKAVVESNKGIISQFVAEAQAFDAEIGAISSKNTAITDVYKTEVAGYASENQAISDNQKSIIAGYDLKIRNAEADSKAAIAQAEISVKGYGSEYSLREKVAESQANIAMQAMSSAYGAVNASAGLSYSGSESQSESWSHGETRSDSYSHSESLSKSESNTYAHGESISESHDYKE